MSSAFDKLERILLLEQEQGWGNRAVIGGLQRFMVYWAKEARQEADSDNVIDEVDQIVDLVLGYDELGAWDRQLRGEQVLMLLRTPAAADLPEAGETPDVAAQANEPDDLMASEQAQPAREPGPARVTEHTRTSAQSASDVPAGSLDDDVTHIKGVSTVYQAVLAKLGIETIRDLLYHFPRRYDDFGQLKAINRLAADDEVTVVGVVRKVSNYRTRRGLPVTSVSVGDASGVVEARWYHQPYLVQKFNQGDEIVVSGKVKQYLGRLYFEAPEWEPLQEELLHTARLVPVYPLTEGIGARQMRRLLSTTLEAWVPRIIDPMPEAVQAAAGLIDLQTALRQIHFPSSQERLEKARERLCFDELLLLQLGILRHRQTWRAERGRVLHILRPEINDFVGGLPFVLTSAQLRAIDDILFDLQQPVPMSRLLQGDVGSGKTIVALIAMLATARNGLQSALMAPTSVLAQQHFQTISLLLEGYKGIRCVLLEGNMSEADKDATRQAIAAGRAQIVVGTHALIQHSVEFDSLGLVVVDEQHRFGVSQRDALRSKGDDVRPHLLAMSATPIPRTLALTLYGDMDVTLLDELPPHRKPVITAVRNRRGRERIYRFMAGEVREGRQIFVICPLVEGADDSDATAAVDERDRLQREVFPDLRIGLMHGRLSAEEKEQVMTAFKAREYDILVSTSVIEVGIDIPNASVILIEGAERFGLAQLHQFRGRVGRGEYKSYCILLSDDPSPRGIERLQIMEETNDGFVLAEKDLEMRGPGDFFGVRQSGMPELKVAQLSDVAVLDKARQQAQQLMAADPQLEQPENRALAAGVRHFWRHVDLA